MWKAAAATLFVTPEGTSLLIDTGWPEGFGEMPSPDGTAEAADRIVAAAKKLGVSKLDYVLVTHYHDDHSGGVAALAQQIPDRGFHRSWRQWRCAWRRTRRPSR